MAISLDKKTRKKNVNLQIAFSALVNDAAENINVPDYLENEGYHSADLIRFHQSLLRSDENYKKAFNNCARLEARLTKDGTFAQMDKAIAQMDNTLGDPFEKLAGTFKLCTFYAMNYPAISKLRRSEAAIDEIFRTAP